MHYRDYKNFHPNGFFHVYNRGHNKDLVFKDEEDYLFFIKRAKQILGLQKTGMSRWMNSLPEGSFSVLSYCLMPNHFHFLILQKTNLPISRFISKLCTSYSIYFNKKYENVGSVFQGRFKAKLVDSDLYLTYLSVYIHKNPKQPFKWPYSSMAGYIGMGRDSLVDKDLIIKMTGGTAKGYREFLDGYTNKDELQISHLTFDD
ncbi:MAG: hypothetical protein A3J46_01600 [Candidatus Yanofskybacteria bacterium RIFCSPHIGHO2_02_FULL_41_11]|uniref:Transposase IS200-like domain-containing protein n=1 Tax=Candidatus Yanofskybacteria bacterium RIFCSPHIGHO2_02_FULL_41_11 TaxID=1802675 RepID=A0A1F8FAR4_9BACT|nr:MAG: hypothetical protein A3J46_01600 [Candidatus Yanofskybacteria bacterium RIFCSPHIGHO2_02_FULL_41_11]